MINFTITLNDYTEHNFLVNSVIENIGIIERSNDVNNKNFQYTSSQSLNKPWQIIKTIRPEDIALITVYDDNDIIYTIEDQVNAIMYNIFANAQDSSSLCHQISFAFKTE